MSSRRAPVTSPCRGLLEAARMNAPNWAWLQSSGPGVVFEDVDGRIADAADRSPVQAAEVDDQVGGDVPDRVVDLLGLEDQRSQRLAVGVGGRLELRLDLVAERLVLGRLDRALRLSPLDVEEDAGIVAPFAPDLGLLPVDVELGERRHLRRVALEDQQPLAHQPLVDAKAAVEPLGAVVGDDQHDRVVGQAARARWPISSSRWR